MSNKITTPPKKEFQSFHDFPIVTDLDDFEADIAFLGIPFGDPYSMGEASNDQCTAPTHIRRYCERALRGLDRYDFDIGGTLLNGEDIKVVDCGDVVGEAKDVAGNHKRSEEAVRKILSTGAMPIILGGDHAIVHGKNSHSTNRYWDMHHLRSIDRQRVVYGDEGIVASIPPTAHEYVAEAALNVPRQGLAVA